MHIYILLVEYNKIDAGFFEAMLDKNDNYILTDILEDAEYAPRYCGNHRVDLILMNVQTKHGHSGLIAAEKIKRQQPHIKIIIVTSLIAQEILDKARQIGVESLWYKDHTKNEIMDVIQQTMEGKHFFPDRSPNVKIGKAWSDELSDMQKNILRLYIRGYAYAAIGKKLFIEERTVKYHMKQMMVKCGFHSKQQLIAAAIESKLVVNLEE